MGGFAQGRNPLSHYQINKKYLNSIRMNKMNIQKKGNNNIINKTIDQVKLQIMQI